jgi:hypothetical protein
MIDHELCEQRRFPKPASRDDCEDISAFASEDRIEDRHRRARECLEVPLGLQLVDEPSKALELILTTDESIA